MTDATGTEPQGEPQDSGAVSAANRQRIDASELKSSYCNVCNITSTREEVVLNFGINDDWDRSQGGAVKLHHRIILSPYSAKRVADMLTDLVKGYESRYGALK